MSTLPALPDELIARVLAFAAPQRRNFAERVDEPSADAACSFLARAVRGDAFYEQRAALMQTCSFCGAEAYATCERCRVVSICDAKACAALYARHAAADQTENGAEDQTVDGAERASGAVTPATLIVVVRDRVAAVGEETHGEDTFFKLKGTTRIDKVFQAYAKRKGTALGGLRFRLPGGRDLEADDTPSSLGLEDQAVIDCFDARKTGSCAKLAEERERLRRGDDVVDVRVKLVSVGAIPRPRLMTESRGPRRDQKREIKNGPYPTALADGGRSPPSR